MSALRFGCIPLIVPLAQANAEGLWLPESQSFDTAWQIYDEDGERIEVEAYYLRSETAIDSDTSVKFQYLHDAISGASPTGALPGGVQPYYAEVEDVREGLLAALAHHAGDHRLEIEISRSEEDDYRSNGLALSDTLELNQKNTEVSFGINVLDDSVEVPGFGERRKTSIDWFTGVSQVIDRNTVISANLTLGYNQGYLNDPYKIIQRSEVETIPDGSGGTIEVPVVNIYRENRPDSRFRQVLLLEGRHYVEPARGALNAALRLSNDDYGIFSQTLELEWRQELGESWIATPFFRFYHQNEADFFARSLDGVPVATPASDPDGSGVNYSADYRLSSFNAISGGLRLSYRFSDHLAASLAYERYVMEGTGSSSSRSQDEAYPSADIVTLGLSLDF